MEPTEDIKLINRKLEEEYGKDVALNLPKFRVVWSEYTEKRYGEFARYTEDGVYLRTECGVFEEPKYIGHCSDKWVLEELRSTKGNPYLELVVPYSYEPVWAFGSGRSNPTPLWRAVQMLVIARLYGDPNAKKKSPADIIADEAARMAKEKENCKAILKNERPNFAGNHASVVDGDAVVIGNTDYLLKGQDNDSNSKSV